MRKPSHPIWVRGLKPKVSTTITNRVMVAPYMGAWIETTISITSSTSGSVSHPIWVRGLKCLALGHHLYEIFAAPYMGAWIETFTSFVVHVILESHPVWVRGLKHCMSQYKA